MARWHVAPTKLDLLIARKAAHHTSPAIETPAKVLTLALDERALIASAAALWLSARANGDRRRRQQANHLLTVVAVTGILPHLVKLIFAQERPNRRFVKSRRRRGIPRSGDACDAFPSGHAVHAGAIAAAAARFFPGKTKVIWTAAGLLAATRIVLFAHWMSDVLIGMGSGVAVERILWTLQDPSISRSRSQSALLRRAPPGRAKAR